MNIFGLVIKASNIIFKDRKYFGILFAASFIFYVAFILIPIFTIPGNDIAFQLSIYRMQDFILMLVLSLLAGFTFVFQAYIYRQKKLASTVSQSVTSGFSGIFAAIVGTAACSSCLASIFGFLGLGFGSVIFVFQYQTYFLLGALILMLISLYFSAKKVIGVCYEC